MLRELTGLAIERWHNVELTGVRQRNVDMLGETADGRLVHIELQSSNDNQMALRMAEYALAIAREFGSFPEQVVLYVGQAPLKMETRIDGPHLTFECRIVDIRELDGERLLNSENLQDNIVGVLAGLSDQRAAVRRVLQRIAESDTKDRPAALAELMVLAGLRKLNSLIEEEVRHMPILDDIMDDEVLGRERKLGIAMGLERGLEKGLEQGLQRGLKEARNEEERVLLQLIEKRFKELPGWAVKKVNGMTASEIREATIRLLDAPTLEDLLR